MVILMTLCKKGFAVKSFNVFQGIAIILLIICYSIAAEKRNNLWHDELILNTDNIHKSPQKARPYLNRGLFYFNNDRIDAAIDEYFTALRLAPNYAYIHNNLGVAYFKKGHLDASIKEFNEALRLYPDYGEAHYNLGVAYGEKGMTGAAYIEIKKAMELNKNLAEGLKYSNPSGQ